MISPPVLTAHLIERLEQAVLHKGCDALLRAAALPGNPYDVSVYQQHGLFASCVGTLPTLPWYNTVSGLREAVLGELDEVLALYTTSGVCPNLSVWATQLTPAVGRALFDRGFTARSVGATLYAVAQTPEPFSIPDVSVRELALDEDTEIFNRVLLEGYEFSHPIQQALALLENEGAGVRRYLACVGGQPAGAATLTERDGIAYLAGAATLPALRGRGAQTALIRARLADAVQTSELVAVTTAFTSRSQQNLEKNGFRLAHIKTSWAPRNSLG